MEKLKPCPCCGATNPFIMHKYCGCKEHTVKAYAVKCSCGIQTDFYKQEITAYIVWNNRSG